MTHLQLPRSVDNTLAGPAPATVTEAIANYRDLTLPIGVDAHDNQVSWPIRTAAHAMMFNTGAAGLSTAVRTVVTQAAHAGMRVVIADFMPAFSEHDLQGFQGWPNVQSATDNPYANIAAIADVYDQLWQRRIDKAEREPILLVVNGITKGLSWLESHAPELDEATRHYWWNPSVRQSDLLEPRPVLKCVREALTGIAALGRELRIHLLLTDLCRSGFRYDVQQLAMNTTWHLICGRHIPAATASLLGDRQVPKRPLDQPDDIRYSALLRASADDSDDPVEYSPVRVYWTPGPNSARCDDDHNLLAKLRPEHSLYPPVDSQLPEEITSWDDIFAATAFLPTKSERHAAAPAAPTRPDVNSAAQFMAAVWTKLEQARRDAETSTRRRFRRPSSAGPEAHSPAIGFTAAMDIVRATATEFGLQAPGES